MSFYPSKVPNKGMSKRLSHLWYGLSRRASPLETTSPGGLCCIMEGGRIGYYWKQMTILMVPIYSEKGHGKIALSQLRPLIETTHCFQYSSLSFRSKRQSLKLTVKDSALSIVTFFDWLQHCPSSPIKALFGVINPRESCHQHIIVLWQKNCLLLFQALDPFSSIFNTNLQRLSSISNRGYWGLNVGTTAYYVCAPPRCFGPSLNT